jgi:hypothetical protein
VALGDGVADPAQAATAKLADATSGITSLETIADRASLRFLIATRSFSGARLESDAPRYENWLTPCTATCPTPGGPRLGEAACHRTFYGDAIGTTGKINESSIDWTLAKSVASRVELNAVSRIVNA